MTIKKKLKNEEEGNKQNKQTNKMNKQSKLVHKNYNQPN